MALIKEKELPSGEIGNYWRITDVSGNKSLLTLSAKISLFKSKELADSGKKDMGLSYFFSGPTTKEKLLGDLFAEGYLMIKDQCSKETISIFDKIKVQDLKDATDN